jgi:RNA polymerase sigma factor (sigma-70 family)
VDYEKLFVSQLPTIEKVVAQVCRRNHLRGAEAEDFASEVKLHIIQDDYEVLRRFRQRSPLHIYLTVVVQRQFLNYRNRMWGRWRPSAEATRLGAVAVLLERLTARDGWSFDEAQQQMHVNYGVSDSREALEALWIRLRPNGSARRFVPVDQAVEMASNAPGPDANILDAERAQDGLRARDALGRALRELTAEERLLLKMFYDDGFTVSQIARFLRMPQKPLYRRFDALRKRLKQRIQADGISSCLIQRMFAMSRLDRMPFNIHRVPENDRG